MNSSDYSNVNTHFLPNIDFRMLWNTEGISDATRETIWKYLQLLLFTLMGSVKDTKNFGNSANIFEAMDEEELHSKISETMSGISEFFSNMDTGDREGEEDTDNHNSSKNFSF